MSPAGYTIFNEFPQTVQQCCTVFLCPEKGVKMFPKEEKKP
jgi:hypothetical protein